ncbi:hypothetical protein BC940DRAFT_292975 [Gongronella butleri]|nr:hypothetical protein BC940DRAFT_292975 [Gongronella butleri]
MAAIAFAETIPQSNDVDFYVEWLDSQNDFPSLDASPKDHAGANHLQAWHYVQAKDAEDESLASHWMKWVTTETDGAWQLVESKQYVDVATEAQHLPEKQAPKKPQRRQQQQRAIVEPTDEEKRRMYWELVDAMENDASGFDDLYEIRKTVGNAGARAHALQYHRRLTSLMHHVQNQCLDLGSKLTYGLNTMEQLLALDRQRDPQGKNIKLQEQHEALKNVLDDNLMFNKRMAMYAIRLAAKTPRTKNSSHEIKKNRPVVLDSDFSL